uniref:INPP5B PH domain-containing protein n=1 Tax=Meleagris gallopavo TaxID=9103 RepID=A0A803XZD6_MELGA
MSVAIQETLLDGATCRAVTAGQSVESRLLGLVERGGQHAIYVYTHRRMAITAEDVWLEKVIPIAEGFAVEEVIPDGDLHVIGSDVTVRICSEGDGLTVQLPFGSHTRTFLQEVSKCSRPGWMGPWAAWAGIKWGGCWRFIILKVLCYDIVCSVVGMQEPRLHLYSLLNLTHSSDALRHRSAASGGSAGGSNTSRQCCVTHLHAVQAEGQIEICSVYSGRPQGESCLLPHSVLALCSQFLGTGST